MLYGIVHDQVTIRICPEYFTIAHPHLIRTESLTLIALYWGVIATWWVGLPLGVVLAIAARAGRLPKVDPVGAGKRIACLLAIVLVLACCAGLIAYTLQLGGSFRASAPRLAERIDVAMHNRFVAAWAMHVTSYWLGALGGLVLAVVEAFERKRAARRHAFFMIIR